MIKAVPLALAIALPFAGAAASDAAVLPTGRYGCWIAGSATGPVMTVIPEREFTIVSGSSYRNAAGTGTYLLASGLLTFTRGPLKDTRLRLSKGGYWQQISRSGELERLKCSRVGGVPVDDQA